MHSILRIIWDVITYRLRRREMANLLSAVTVLFAVGTTTAGAAVRIVFALVLNVLVYLTNDYYDVEADLQDSSKSSSKSEFLHAHETEARMAQAVLLAVSLAIAASWSVGLVVTLALAAGLCWAYSAKLKRAPGLDLVVILLCGVTSAMTAFPLDRTLGWVLAGQLGLFAAAFQTVQMLRDLAPDTQTGTRTTAVHLGRSATIWLHRALLVASAVYATLLIHRWLGLAMLVAAVLPVRGDRADKHWNELRVVLGIGWLLMVGSVVLTGTTSGWLAQITRDMMVGTLTLLR